MIHSPSAPTLRATEPFDFVISTHSVFGVEFSTGVQFRARWEITIRISFSELLGTSIHQYARPRQYVWPQYTMPRTEKIGLKKYDCQNFQQVFTEVPVHIKHVFTGVPKFQTSFQVIKPGPRCPVTQTLLKYVEWIDVLTFQAAWYVNTSIRSSPQSGIRVLSRIGPFVARLRNFSRGLRWSISEEERKDFRSQNDVVVPLYMYIYVRVYVYIYIYIYVYIYNWVYTHTYIHVCIHIDSYIYQRTCVYKYICIRIHVYIYMYTYTNLHTHERTHIHTFTHIQILTLDTVTQSQTDVSVCVELIYCVDTSLGVLCWHLFLSSHVETYLIVY